MNTHGIFTRRRLAAAASACLFGGLAAATIIAPSASAAPDCSPAGINGTVDSVTIAAQQYLAAHPGAGGVVSSAVTQRACNTTVLPPYLASAYSEFVAG